MKKKTFQAIGEKADTAFRVKCSDGSLNIIYIVRLDCRVKKPAKNKSYLNVLKVLINRVSYTVSSGAARQEGAPGTVSKFGQLLYYLY